MGWDPVDGSDTVSLDRQGTAWVHVGTMPYLVVGMAGFIVYPLFRAVVAARARLSESDYLLLP